MLRCRSAARVAASEARALFATPSAVPTFVQVHSDVSISSWPIVPARVVHTLRKKGIFMPCMRMHHKDVRHVPNHTRVYGPGAPDMCWRSVYCAPHAHS